jgi:hypothetical protein
MRALLFSSSRFAQDQIGQFAEIRSLATLIAVRRHPAVDYLEPLFIHFMDSSACGFDRYVPAAADVSRRLQPPGRPQV